MVGKPQMTIISPSISYLSLSLEGERDTHTPLQRVLHENRQTLPRGHKRRIVRQESYRLKDTLEQVNGVISYTTEEGSLGPPYPYRDEGS